MERHDELHEPGHVQFQAIQQPLENIITQHARRRRGRSEASINKKTIKKKVIAGECHSAATAKIPGIASATLAPTSPINIGSYPLRGPVL